MIFRFVDGDIVFRTRAKGSLAAAAGFTVSFELDRIDEAMSEVWSVLVSRRCNRRHALSRRYRSRGAPAAAGTGAGTTAAGGMSTVT